MIENKLFQFWRTKEIELGREIQIEEVAKETGIHRNTISRLRSGAIKQYDERVLSAICEYFGVPDGGPIPFLVYRRRE